MTNQRGTIHDEELPPFSRRLNGWFMFYVRRYLRRHFHAVRLLRAPPGDAADHPDIAGEPVIFFTNHPGWWDPLVFLACGEILYPDRLSYGPIHSGALGKYRFLERIGFVGIEPGTWHGSARFLRLARAAGRRTDVILWVTSQGQFVDPRARPVEIQPGVAHAVAAAGRGLVVPCAVEYPFWTERLPEALVAFGPTMRVADFPGRDVKEWDRALAAALEATQDRLSAAACRRDPRGFRSLLVGRVGVGFVYDCVRRLSAWCRGERFDASHGGDAAGDGISP
jgi:1-acyl-sn-glycerol-3-phosphate acyltransferase